MENRSLIERAAWTGLDDQAIVAQCSVDLYRASGPGGQKRNKTSSAVRLRHLPSGIIVIAEESRSQHENRARAVKRLRRALWLSHRQPPPPDAAGLFANGFPTARAQGFLPAAALVLDMLDAEEGRVSDAARRLGTGSAALTLFLRQDEEAWREAAHIRQRHGLPALR